jgi:hypothetical protein
MAKFFKVFNHLYCLMAALAPMLTWSSWPLEDTIESTEAGVQYCLFWLTIEAAVY